MAVAGRCPVSLNHSKAIYAKDVDVDATKNQTLHALATGKVVRSQGAAKYAWTITFVCPEDKAQFVQLQDGGIDSDSNDELTISYTKGGESYMLLDCGINSDKTSSDQDGKLDQVLSGVATARRRTA
ncbi:hypothetical protein [uncultured Zoogloea sp.]|uniref:hypothetical protein n=1 Tax=uncultured Zoogloea sp. TaxID=160237 RepID=UPI00261CF007|nr:hypothetical protein [uncultured Zoogloea sp.]